VIHKGWFSLDGGPHSIELVMMGVDKIMNILEIKEWCHLQFNYCYYRPHRPANSSVFYFASADHALFFKLKYGGEYYYYDYEKEHA
jgi:hypothetical protein